VTGSIDFEAVPRATRWRVGIATGLGVGSWVLAVLGTRSWVAAIALAATIGTALDVIIVLRRRERMPQRLLLWAVVPPTALFLPTLLGGLAAFLFGVTAGVVVLPLALAVQREPARWLGPTLVWLVLVGLCGLGMRGWPGLIPLGVALLYGLAFVRGARTMPADGPPHAH